VRKLISKETAMKINVGDGINISRQVGDKILKITM
jgi:hypothetical protein